MGRKGVGYLPKAAVSRLLVKAGADRVSGDAAVALARFLEKKGIEIGELAAKQARMAGRKTVQQQDVEAAIES
jgi:histone H3/H4